MLEAKVLLVDGTGLGWWRGEWERCSEERTGPKEGKQYVVR